MDLGKINLSRPLLSGLFWVLLANVIVKPLWLLGVEVGVQNAVGNEMYGFYYSIFSFAYIFNILLDLGLTNYNTRNIAQHPQLIRRHLSGILGIKICLLAFYVVVTFSVGAIMGYGGREFKMLAWLCVVQGLNSLLLYLRSNFEGLLLFRWSSLFSVLDRMLMIVICGCMIWTPLRTRFNIMWFVYAQVAAYAVSVALALAVIGRKAGLRGIRWDRRFFLVVLRQSAPFALLVLLMAAYGHVDSVILRAVAGDAPAGVYAGAFRLLDALTMVAYLVSVPLLPVYSRLCKQHDRPAIIHNTRLVFYPLMLFSLVLSVGLAIGAEPVMHLLYGDGAVDYVPVFRVIIFNLIPIGLTYIFGTLLTAGGHLRWLNILAACSLAIGVVANMVLIPRMGAVGSAWASLSAQSVMAAGEVVLATKHYLVRA